MKSIYKWAILGALVSLMVVPYVMGLRSTKTDPISTNPNSIEHLTSSVTYPLYYAMGVHCAAGTGTAWISGPNQLITAYHVVESGKCSVSGVPIKIERYNEEMDYAIMSFMSIENLGVPSPPLNCSPRNGEYLAMGYARGLPSASYVEKLDNILVDKPLDKIHKINRYRGNVIEGMSGGPVFDKTGAVSGMIIGYIKYKVGPRYALIRELKDIDGLCGEVG